MFEHAPSWSIAGKKQQTRKSDTPAPCYYYPDKWVNDHSPTWKIGTSQRNKQNKQLVLEPGPGHYLSNKLKNESKLGKFNNQNRLKQQINQNPSPNNYSPNYGFIQSSSPKACFTAKQKIIEKDKVPGPGQYNIKCDQKNQVNVKIGRQRRFQTQKIIGPGPQSYTPIKMNFKKISISFNRQNKRFANYGQNQHTKIPGPGQYTTLDLFQKSLKYKKGYSIAGKLNQIAQNEIPGPGLYSPINQSLNLSPKFTMKGKYYDKKIENTPGPAQYCSKNIFKQGNQGFSIGRQLRNSVSQFQNIPGPGSYDPVVNLRKTPIYSLSGSRTQLKRSDSPGPGAYNADRNVVKKRPQSAKIGTAKRTLTQKQVSPGPGNYQVKKKSTANGCSFSKQKKSQKILTLTPGPGQYDIKPIIGQTQSYFKKQ